MSTLDFPRFYLPKKLHGFLTALFVQKSWFSVNRLILLPYVHSGFTCSPVKIVAFRNAFIAVLLGFLSCQNARESSWADSGIASSHLELHSRQRMWLFQSYGILLHLQDLSIAHFCMEKTSGWKMRSSGRKKNELSGTDIACLLLQNLSALDLETEINVFIIGK